MREHIANPDITVVALPEARRDELCDIDQWAFASAEESLAPDLSLLGFEWERTFGAEINGALSGVNSVYSLRMPVPGGEVPAAGLTSVGVHPQYRRRGVLSAMMRHHLSTVHEAGCEPVSALFAAEPAIYGRFGYGMATRNFRLTLNRRAPMIAVAGTESMSVRMEKANADRHAAIVAEVYERAHQGRPGMDSRGSAGLQRRVFRDPPVRRRGGEALRLLLVLDDSEQVAGYALFRRTENWTDTGPRGTVNVTEAVALDPAASAVLWGRLSDLDLMSTVSTDSRPSDDPLLHQLVDLRAAGPRMGDGLWVRLVDVGAALAARRYSSPVDLVLDVRDELCPWNARRWRLSGDADGATCTPTRDSPDVGLDVRALGSAFLGGETLAALAAAGLVQEGTPGALACASSALAWPVAPYCGWIF